MQKQSFLVVAPHADDEWLGAGGTLMRMGEDGHRISLLLMASAPEDPGGRDMEFRESAKRLNTSWAEMAGLPDSLLDTVPMRDVVRPIEKAIDETVPTVLMIPEPGVHQDHAAVHRACLAAIRTSRRYIPPTVVVYEVPTGTTGRDFTPNLWVDIGGHIEAKSEGFEEIYRSQVGPGRDADTILRHAAYRGKEAMSGYAEAFQLWRGVI